MKRTSFSFLSHRRWAFGLVASLAVSAPPGVALAQAHSAVDVAQARELLNQGMQLRQSGDLAGALQKLQAAHALINTPITAVELGRTYLAAGRLVEARETFLSVARIPPSAEETKRSASARADAAQLAEQVRPRIASLLVKVTGVPANTVAVTIDGAAVPSEALAAPRLVDPGTHDIAARSTSGGTAETKVEVKEGESRDVELKLAFSAGTPQPTTPPVPTTGPTEPPAPPPSPTPSRSHALEWSLIGGGAAVAAAGVVLMLVETSSANDAVTRLDHSGYDSAKSTWTLGLVGTIVGAAAVASGGIVLAATSGKPATGMRAPVWIGAGAIGAGANGLKVGGAW